MARETFAWLIQREWCAGARVQIADGRTHTWAVTPSLDGGDVRRGFHRRAIAGGLEMGFVTYAPIILMVTTVLTCRVRAGWWLQGRQVVSDAISAPPRA